MSDTPGGPPPEYASYYRPTSVYGTAAQLQALSDGYVALNIVFAVNVVLGLTVSFGAYGIRAALGPGVTVVWYIAGYLFLGIAVGVLTYVPNKKIGVGKGWSSGVALVASILMAVNAVFCCGLIGYMVMQQIAATEMKKYGVRLGLLGLRRREVQPLIEELERQEQQQPSGTPPVQ
jgi:hypothetical protein